MTRLDRLRNMEIDCSKECQRALKSGNLFDIQKAHKRLDYIRSQIRAEGEYAAKRLTEQMPKEVLKREHIPELIGEIHMIMDILVDALTDLRFKLNKYNLTENTITKSVKQAEDSLNILLSDTCKLSEYTQSFIVNNSELIEKTRELIKEYVNTRIG